MAIRRGKKEGTIYKRNNGTWRAQISVDRNRFSFTGNTQRDCRQWLQDMQRRSSSGLNHEGMELTFGEYLAKWLLTITPNIRSSTLRQYTQVVRQYITPNLGKIKLVELKPYLIQQLYDKLIARGKGRRTVQVVHAVIHRSLNQAVKLGILDLNPDDSTSPPKTQEKEIRVLDQDQVHALLSVAKSKGFHHFALYYVALVTGMRQGELLGLKWNDFDPERKTIKVTRQVQRVQGGGFEFSPPKTKKGFRTIKLGGEAVNVLRRHYIAQLDYSSREGDKWQDHTLIFPSVVGTPINPPNLVKAFRALLEKAGLPRVRFHSLRHTAASLMLNNGVDVLVVSRRLGHSKPSITLDVYGHLIPSSQQKVADLMDNLITPNTLELHPTAPELHPEEIFLLTQHSESSKKR